MSGKPKVLIFDIETTNLELRINSYQLRNYQNYFNHKDITRDWSILSVAWKWLGDSIVNCVSVRSNDVFNDYGVVHAFHDVLMQADYIIGHNSDKFDVRKFNTRVIKHGLIPVHPITSIDTLKEARKIGAFTSNTLSYLLNYFGLAQKEESPDWLKILAGDDDEIRFMRHYNKQDVIGTEQLYLKLRPYMKTHPNFNLVADIRDVAGISIMTCPACLGTDVKKDGFRIIKKIKKQHYRCKSCSKPFH